MSTVNESAAATQPEADRPLGTRYASVFAALAAAFDPDEVKSRSQAGRTFSYVTARTVANRLDDVLGPENWRQEFTETKLGLKCRLWFRLAAGGEWSWKEDGGGFAGMPSGDDNEKSGYSDSFKRAAAMLGPGRYLYRDGIPHFGEVPGEARAEERSAPSQARPAYSDAQRRDNGRQVNQGEPRSRKQYDGPDRPPTTGRALFAWAKTTGERTGMDVIGAINHWAKQGGVPGRIVDWQGDVVREAHEAAMGAVGQPAGGDTDSEDGVPF